MNENDDNSKLENLEKNDDSTQPSESNEVVSKLITKSRMLDFILGIVAFGMVDGIITLVCRLLAGPSDKYVLYEESLSLIIIFWVSFINLIGIYIFFRRGNYLFTAGILSLVIYPLLLLNSCMK